MLFIVLFLLLFGLVMLYSTSSYEANIKFEDPAFYFRKQAIASAIGIGVMLAMMFIDYHIVQRFAALAYVVSLVLIILVDPSAQEIACIVPWHIMDLMMLENPLILYKTTP